jgi:hypothetical protein
MHLYLLHFSNSLVKRFGFVLGNRRPQLCARVPGAMHHAAQQQRFGVFKSARAFRLVGGRSPSHPHSAAAAQPFPCQITVVVVVVVVITPD